MNNKKRKILYVSPEVFPFSGTGGLSEVAGSLPKALNSRKSCNIECRVISPLYKSVAAGYRKKMRFLGHMDIPVAWRHKYMGVFELKLGGTVYYFIDNEGYFKRDQIYGHGDDCERFTYFSRAVFESMKFTGFIPDIIHANDWQTAMVPVYQNTLYRMQFLSTVFTIHNVEYQGEFSMDVVGDLLGIPPEAAHLVQMEDHVNLLKGAIECAKAVSTVSPTYAGELMDPANAFGLDAIIRRNAGKLRGILNGIDTDVYDPSGDRAIEAVYSSEKPEGKSLCKAALQRELWLPERVDVPIVSVVSRLVSAKGFDLVKESIDGFLYHHDLQFILLGTGDSDLEDFFHGLEGRHRDKARCLIKFDKDQAHRIYAGSDIFLMPSRSEACGLSQMIACRYGLVPVVRKTGGLADSIRDCRLGEGNGFVFETFTSADMCETLLKAMDLYQEKEDWMRLIRHNMAKDFTWRKAAEKYAELYHSIGQ